MYMYILYLHLYIHRPRASVRQYDGEGDDDSLENSKIMFSFPLRNLIIDNSDANILFYSFKYQTRFFYMCIHALQVLTYLL
jgi:hypothetical protein